MSGLNDELWMKERYEQVCRKNPEEYALISLKIKRFRIFNRLFGREAGDWLVGQVYEAIRTWIGEDEYVAHIQLGYFNLLVHMPEDYEEIFQLSLIHILYARLLTAWASIYFVPKMRSPASPRPGQM